MNNFDVDEISDRLREELTKISPNMRELSRIFSCDYKVVQYWFSARSVPSPYYLTAMYWAGVDIIYILTGERTRGGERRA